MKRSSLEKPFQLLKRERWLVADFAEQWAILSWAIVNGGRRSATKVGWLYIEPDEIACVLDAGAWLRERMDSAGLTGAVGFMTGRRLHAFVEAAATEGDCRAWAIATVGLSNALRAGDPTGCPHGATINLLVCCSRALHAEAAVEAICLASEAKALAMLESGTSSVQSGSPATGTGTDYVAVASPLTGVEEAYAGKHTAVGSAIGRAAYRAIARGIEVWNDEYRRDLDGP